MELSQYHIDVLCVKVCPYCKSTTEVVSETDVYGREYKGRKMIRCRNYMKCNSYVGTHDDGSTLGRLANKELRQAKIKAHSYFDRLWKEKLIGRTKLYEDLSDYLELPDKYTHIGMFNKTTCLKVVEWCNSLYNDLRTSKKNRQR